MRKNLPLKQNQTCALVRYKALQRVKHIVIFIRRRFKKNGRFILIRIALIFIYMVGASPIAFCDDGGLSSKEIITALTIAGVTTASFLILGVRYFLFGNTASGLIDQGKNVGTELLSKAKDNAKEISTHLLDKTKTDAQQVLGADSAKELVDQLISSINPLNQVRLQSDAAKAKMEILLRKIFQNHISNKASTSQWVEAQWSSLRENDQTRVAEGLQSVLKALEKDNPHDINKAFGDLTDTDMETLADYVCVSLSRPNSGAGSIEAPSIVEPLCLQYPSFFIIFILLVLKLAPFYLYIGIKLKRSFLFNN